MKNVHILSTDKPSRLHYSKVKTDEKISYKLILKQESLTCNDGLLSGQKNIYITNDEEIKEGDWLLIIDDFETYVHEHKGDNLPTTYYKKIILTTDQNLIKDGVQAIDDEFLEWFVKNPSCEEVKVETDIKWKSTVYDQPDIEDGYIYKLIIPQEEPKALTKLEIARNIAAIGIGKKKEPKQETLEEAAEKYSSIAFYGRQDLYDGFIAGAKWMRERMYSEEEVFTICRAFATFVQRNGPSYKKQQEWFELLKKK